MARTRSSARIGWLPASVTWIASTRPIADRTVAIDGGGGRGDLGLVGDGHDGERSRAVDDRPRRVADRPGILPTVSQPALAAPTGLPDPADSSGTPVRPAPDGPPPAVDADASDSLWSPDRRALTLGLVLTITLVAFEALAVSTVMPIVAKDLGGLELYGWVFSAFFLGSLIGIVVVGGADRPAAGSARPFVDRPRPVRDRPADRRPRAVDADPRRAPGSSRASAPARSRRSPTSPSAGALPESPPAADVRDALDRLGPARRHRPGDRRRPSARPSAGGSSSSACCRSSRSPAR